MTARERADSMRDHATAACIFGGLLFGLIIIGMIF